MVFEFTLSHMLFIVIASVSGIWALMKIIAVQERRFFVQQFSNHEKTDVVFRDLLNKRLDTIESLHQKDVNQWQRVERELLTLKADLPLHYVRREDYIRGQSILEAKLDGLGMKIENAQLRNFKTAT